MLIALLSLATQEVQEPKWIVIPFGERKEPVRYRHERAVCLNGTAEVRYSNRLSTSPIISLSWAGRAVPAEQLRWLNEQPDIRSAQHIYFSGCFTLKGDDFDGSILTAERMELVGGTNDTKLAGKSYRLSPSGVTESSSSR